MHELKKNGITDKLMYNCWKMLEIVVVVSPLREMLSCCLGQVDFTVFSSNFFPHVPDSQETQASCQLTKF